MLWYVCREEVKAFVKRGNQVYNENGLQGLAGKWMNRTPSWCDNSRFGEASLGSWVLASE